MFITPHLKRIYDGKADQWKEGALLSCFGDHVGSRDKKVNFLFLLSNTHASMLGYFLKSFQSWGFLREGQRPMQVSWFSHCSAPFSVDYRACAMTKRAAETGLEFFSAWFCPYAQRAWIALEHHGLKYSKVEGLLPDAPGQDFKSYKKHPRLLELTFDLMLRWQLFSFLSIFSGRQEWDAGSHTRSSCLSFGRNPKGLVPTLCEDGMPPVYESAVCVEYIDELAARGGGNSSLMPGSPAERAALRLKVDWINKILGDK